MTINERTWPFVNGHDGWGTVMKDNFSLTCTWSQSSTKTTFTCLTSLVAQSGWLSSNTYYPLEPNHPDWRLGMESPTAQVKQLKVITIHERIWPIMSGHKWWGKVVKDNLPTRGDSIPKAHLEVNQKLAKTKNFSSNKFFYIVEFVSTRRRQACNLFSPSTWRNQNSLKHPPFYV